MLILLNHFKYKIRLFKLKYEQPVNFKIGRYFLIANIVILSVSGSSFSEKQLKQQYYCELRGSFYIEEYPDRANFLIYEEESEAFADMLIYETDNALFADKPGLWYFTDQRAFADFTIYFVESKGNADFTVYFTSFESFAGCNN